MKTSSACIYFNYIYVDEADTDATARQVLEHNLKYQNLCE